MMAIFIFILGAIVGSFLNVCIVRFPKEESIVFPSSHCVHCKKPIFWYDNVPLISYWILKGRCRFCQKPISIRYFFVELVTAMTFTLFYLYFRGTLILIPYLVMVSGFIVATFVDFKHRIIPDEVSVGGTIAGLILSLLIPELQGIRVENYQSTGLAHLHGLGLSFLGAVVGGGLIYAMGMLGDFLFKKESMGGGDIKLLAMIGAFLGWQLAILTFFLAPFFGAIVGVIEKIRTKESTIAYGPYLVLGALISLFYGHEIIRWILKGYGLF